MNAINWYFAAFRKYAEFHDRSSRSAYWYFMLFNLLFSIPLYLLWLATGYIVFDILYMLYSLAVFIPALAISVRRLHDTNRSGWWMLLDLLPIVGPIILLIFMIQDSDSDTNRFGTSPKGAFLT